MQTNVAPEISSQECAPEWCAVFHHPVPDQVLVWYRMGRLKTSDEETLESHLVLCPICQLQLGDLEVSKADLGQLPERTSRRI